ncbi:DUF1304 domain-containing protein [Allokutzneria sp. A3M-2-11 16]|uniref:DUF1304 domain-containing protein n=1 Tax=Allokutzneria sp. A3M-2-11 16 TaxID=2962043 RepID=UPI0020B70BAA|nr:DUF1304 domain-containing protein [Allokutzneria sp. A3M-2-11 16]MCP3803703.1 DUF1304 domain-containing protein [Allokutzneria sp. A3M-2-11 16]
MQLLADILVGALAVLHGYILVLEMFLWQTPRARAAFGTDPEFAAASAPLAANQGLYNGFLAAGLVWGLVAGGDTGFQFKIFFTVCVIVAGVYGAATATKRILFVQVIPGALTLAALLLA